MHACMHACASAPAHRVRTRLLVLRIVCAWCVHMIGCCAHRVRKACARDRLLCASCAHGARMACGNACAHDRHMRCYCMPLCGYAAMRLCACTEADACIYYADAGVNADADVNAGASIFASAAHAAYCTACCDACMHALERPCIACLLDCLFCASCAHGVCT